MKSMSDPVQRTVYDDIHGYSLTLINPFVDDSTPKDHIFFNEFSYIGVLCNCTSKFLNMLQKLKSQCRSDAFRIGISFKRCFHNGEYPMAKRQLNFLQIGGKCSSSSFNMKLLMRYLAYKSSR
ncbi:unnamed protein product [Vicia faba]|uniref:Uncharacterized protein n=1 Tax=Vicia faba TaxID=3906 RepID=A0AAV0YUT8_VICFA|nr:unnamed protein product [Vicia faba]